jgi:hypothetical protein
MATSMAVEEQLYDQLVSEIETLSKKAAPATLPWIQQKAFEFQYSSTIPQILQFDETNKIQYYSVVNTIYQIITNCSVSNSTLNRVLVKVAKGPAGSLAQQLSAAELSAFQFYMKQIQIAGIEYNCVSLAADRVKTAATVYYDGAYSGTISTDLETAYKNYLNNIPFDGVIKLVDIIIALRQVTGVSDVIINEMVARPNSGAFGTGITLVSANRVIVSDYDCVAGYILDEDTSGNTFVDLLTLVVA